MSMGLKRRSVRLVLPLLLGLTIFDSGTLGQDNSQTQISFRIPEELRRFSTAASERDEPFAEPGFRLSDADRLKVKDPFNGSATSDGGPDHKSPPVSQGSKAQSRGQNSFRMATAIKQSLILLAVQHGFRLTQEKTRRELGGPFFEDWGRSVKGLQGWHDSDSAFTNYVAHPLQGATTGRIYVTNSRDGEMAEFGRSRKYWRTRLEALAWSTFWSTQFELGPISEATIGNVGMTKKHGQGTMGWTDLVMTPTAGTAILVGEDAIEKYVLKRMLRKTGGRVTTKVKIWRSFLTPTMSITNLLNGKPPWSRRSNFSASNPVDQPGDTGEALPRSKIDPNRDK